MTAVIFSYFKQQLSVIQNSNNNIRNGKRRQNRLARRSKRRLKEQSILPLRRNWRRCTDRHEPTLGKSVARYTRNWDDWT